MGIHWSRENGPGDSYAEDQGLALSALTLEREQRGRLGGGSSRQGPTNLGAALAAVQSSRVKLSKWWRGAKAGADARFRPSKPRTSWWRPCRTSPLQLAASRSASL